MKKIVVVIVSYNVKYYIEQCIRSVLWSMRGINGEIIVVDNHSRDGSVEHLRKVFGQQVTVISSNHNLGFSKANNIAIQQSSSEYVLLLNPDTVITDDTLRETLAFMDAHPKAGAAGVRMIKSDGSNAMESRRGVPTPMTAFYKMCGLCSAFPDSPRFGHYYMSNMPWDKPGRIEVVSGAFCLLRRTALDEVGLLDEDYFMYGEDIDLSYRMLQAGWENWYIPSVILHYKGESTHKSSFRYVHVFYNAMLIFFRKHFGHFSFLISLPIKLAIFVRAVIAFLSMSMRDWRRSVGLGEGTRYDPPFYVFIGSRFTLSQCRQIAHSKGLDAQFVEGTIGTMPNGHRDIHLPDDRPLIIVYDVHAFSFAQIFSFFDGNTDQQRTIGTYDNTTHKIITQTEIVYDQHNSHL